MPVVLEAMRIPRLTRFLGVGLAIGIWYSAFVHSLEAADVGGNLPEQGIRITSSILLGFFSLPWSMPVWLLGVMGSGIVGSAVPLCPAWLYWCMPPVAGIGWGWLASVVFTKPRSGQPSHDYPSP